MNVQATPAKMAEHVWMVLENSRVFVTSATKETYAKASTFFHFTVFKVNLSLALFYF